VDWNKIKAEYIAGGTSYRKLAAKYNVSFSNLKNVAIREQWSKLREQAENRTTTKLVEDIAKQNAKIDDKYFNLVDKLLDKAEEVIDNTPIWQCTSLKEMASALKYLKECKGVKSDADIREQEARIKKLQKDAEADNTESNITVTFATEKGEDKWAE
jgi:hypothetical protein